MRGIVTGAALLLAACSGAQAERVQLSGRSEQRPIPVGAFDKVELKGPDSVIVRVGDAPSVSMQGDSAVLDRMDIRVEDGKLVVRRKDRFSNVSGPRDRATVTVSVPRLAAAAVGGSGEMRVDRAGGGDAFAAAVGGSGNLTIDRAGAAKIEAAVGGSGNLRLGEIQADSVELAIGGSGTIDVSGRARAVEAAIGGSGDILASRLAARTAEVSIAGSGNAAVNASDTADISIAGSGDVVVHGGARCQTAKMGSGSVRCGGAS